MKLENYLNKDIVLTQVKSSSKLTPRQKNNLRGLGLKKIGSKSNLKANNSIIGMIQKVQHIIKIS